MGWTKEAALERIRDVGIIPIVRTPSPDEAFQAAQAIIEGGVGIAEITMTVPNAIRVVERVAKRYGDQVLLGAGTILDLESCRAALEAGAEFVVAPSLDRRVIEETLQRAKVSIPGALTPTEIVVAWKAGADLIKIFPCEPVGGPKYIKALRGPFPQLRFVPTGGVTLESTPAYIRAGAAALAVGGELVDLKALREGRLDAIRGAAQKFVEAVRAARAALTR